MSIISVVFSVYLVSARDPHGERVTGVESTAIPNSANCLYNESYSEHNTITMLQLVHCLAGMNYIQIEHLSYIL